jgi:hypothetical protein
MSWNNRILKQQLSHCVTLCDYVMIRHHFEPINQICVTTLTNKWLRGSVRRFTINL